MTLGFSGNDEDVVPVRIVDTKGLDVALDDLPGPQSAWVRATGFRARIGQVALVPGDDGAIAMALAGIGDESARARVQFPLGDLASKLPEGGTYRFENAGEEEPGAALSWLLGQYTFDRYRDGKEDTDKHLALSGTFDESKIENIANAVALARDLINTPANDMGPDKLEAAFVSLANEFSAEVTVTRGDGLLKSNFPLIHAVGRASDQEPRLLDLRWGKAGDPTVTLVGKGVCFDTGGLNIKPGNSMGLMKKDMGGAATTMALARMIMSQELPVSLRLLVPAVENSISAGAFRPGDVLTSRKSLTVEINNTDAEGRLVLADALALGDEEEPELMVCMATLTGAARVALGPDVPPFYTDDDALARDLAKAADRVADPIWRMPFYDGYEKMIEPGIADLDNAPAGGFGGSITAALFLRRFVGNARSFAHFDVYGWTPSPRPGRPKGGECQAARAVFDVLETRYGNDC